MKTNEYDVPDEVRIRGQFNRTDTDALEDPTTVVIRVRQPDGSLLIGAPIHDSLGMFHADFTITQEGWHDWKVTGMGAVVGARSGGFLARRQPIPS